MNDNDTDNFNELSAVYSSVLEITELISQLIDSGELHKIAVLLDSRGELLKQADSVLTKAVFSESQKAEISIVKKKILTIEEKNISILEGKKEEIKKSLFEVNINKKTISAYKLKDVSVPRLFDETE